MNLNNLRNSLNSLASEFRGRRLLPVMLVLLAVAVAIPLLLSHSGKASVLAPLPPAPTITAPAPAPAPAAATNVVRHSVSLTRRQLSLPAHNPFVTVQKKSATTSATSAKTAATAATIAPTKAQTSTTASSASQHASTTAGHTHATPTAGSRSVAVAHTVTVSAPPVTHTVTETTTTKPSPTPLSTPYSDYQVQAAIRQSGAVGPARVYHNLARYQFVPSDDSAFASFLGVRSDEKTAVFVIGKGEIVTGHGQCAPSAVTCTFLMLQPGQTANVTVPSGDSFKLTDVGVHKVMSSASIVNVDLTGRSVVTAAEHYVKGLKSLTFARYTGLLHIGIGTAVPVSH